MPEIRELEKEVRELRNEVRGVRELENKVRELMEAMEVEVKDKIIVKELQVVTNRQCTFKVDKNGQITARVNELLLANKAGKTIFQADKNGQINIGGSGNKGRVLIKNGDGKLYALFQPNMLLLYDSDGHLSVNLNGLSHILSLNGNTGKSTILLEGKSGEMRLRNADGKDRVLLEAKNANLYLGGNGADGDVVLFSNTGDNKTLSQATIHLDGNGKQIVLKVAGKNRIRIDGDGGNVWLGGNGADGDVVLFSNTGDNKTLSQATIHLDGNSGDIKLSGADCAEDFNVLESEQIEPGAVLVVGQEDILRQSKKAYDKRVVGVVSGAGNCKPGIILDKKHSQYKRLPVALTGKVYCKVEAQHAPIEVGDLLTTSTIPGHAMKATDRKKSVGSIIGKALSPLSEGVGFVNMLVTLQ